MLADASLPLSGLGQLGAVGAVLSILLTFGWLEIKHERTASLSREAQVREDARQDQRELQRRLDEAFSELARLNELIRERYVKGLEDGVHALQESHELITILRDNLRQQRSP